MDSFCFFDEFYRFTCFTLVMKKKESKPQTVVTYLKVSPYIKSWLECKHRRHICFPYMTQMHSCLLRHLVCNNSMSFITAFSYSQQAFNYKNTDLLPVSCPDESDKGQFIAIVLPETIYKGYSLLKVTPYYQLSKQGAISLRDLIKNEFMVDLFSFIDECMIRAKLNGTKVTREQAIDDFITIHGIEMSYRDNFYRYFTRERKKMLEEIEKRRDEREDAFDRQYVYT